MATLCIAVRSQPDQDPDDGDSTRASVRRRTSIAEGAPPSRRKSVPFGLQ